MAKRATKKASVDVFEDYARKPDATALEAAMPSVRRAVELAATIASLEDAVEAHRKDYNKIVGQELPEALQKAGLQEFTTIDGDFIELKKIIAGSLPKDTKKRDKAMQWIDKAGGGSIIRRKFTVELAKGADELATKLRNGFERAHIDYNEDVGVHPQSLYAFCRERLERGEEVPIDTLGLFITDVAKIKLGVKNNAAASPQARQSQQSRQKVQATKDVKRKADGKLPVHKKAARASAPSRSDASGKRNVARKAA